MLTKGEKYRKDKVYSCVNNLIATEEKNEEEFWYF